jgi:DNA ligase D-like protein (predicted 3'-phosphoesterase)
MAGTLDEYNRKRRFERTPEPRGQPGDGSREPIFVVQKHDARNLHYDVRIEVDGVLKSWAVPKGPSTDPSQKRLALPTEDHPLDYADFEGVIPEGEYGAGAMIVWDAGTYQNLKEDERGRNVPMAETLADGHVEIRLEGRKLRGGYALVRTAPDASGRERWLLIKMRDAEADPGADPVSDRPDSVRSGRTLDEVREEEG